MHVVVGSRRARAAAALPALLLSACSFSASLSTDAIPTPTPTVTPPASPTAPPTPSATPGQPVEIDFAPGRTATSVRGTADRGQQVRWVFAARAGQTAELATTSASGDVGFGLTSPAGALLQRPRTSVRRGSYRLPETGRYQVTVIGVQAGTPYVLTVRIPPARGAP